MIVTTTFNPTVDSLYFLDHFLVEGEHNRVENPIKMIGGKGINASRVLSTLRANFVAITVGGGSSLEFLMEQLTNDNIPTHILPIQEDIRSAMTFMANGTHTELVEKGPKIDETVFQSFLDKVEALNQQEKISILTINGSIVTDNPFAYADLIEKLYQQYGDELKIILDASQTQLKNVLASEIQPYFIKPNTKELSEFCGEPIQNKSDVITFLKAGNFKHIPFVLVSMGEQGGVARFEDKLYDIVIPEITMVNPTGSGDSTVAGICYGLDNHWEIERTLQLAMACGMSNAMQKGVGVINSQVVEQLMTQIKVTSIDIE